MSGEILESDIAIAQTRIVGLGDYEADEVIDLEGSYVAPGLIDAHVHIESSLVPPIEFARAVVPLGTTTVITDPHEIANVLGLDGIRFMFESAKDGPLSMYVMASSCVPATPMETSGATLKSYDLTALKSDPWVLGLAEVMNFPGVVYGDAEGAREAARLRRAGDRRSLPRPDRQTALRLRRRRHPVGSRVHDGRRGAREAPPRDDDLHPRGDQRPQPAGRSCRWSHSENHHRICFCTDDRQPADLLDEGHIDYMVRVAIEEGVDPLTALRMATWNTAQYFRLWDRGAVTPGRRADLMVFDDLQGAARPSRRAGWQGSSRETARW